MFHSLAICGFFKPTPRSKLVCFPLANMNRLSEDSLTISSSEALERVEGFVLDPEGPGLITREYLALLL